MDLHGYCLNAETGKQVWKTEKFGYNSGFHSWWPVVWVAKKKVVFVGTTPNYRAGSSPGRRALRQGIPRRGARGPVRQQAARAPSARPARPRATGPRARPPSK